MDCLYFKTNKFQYWKWFWYRIECIYYFWKEQNESINRLRRGGSLSVSAEELGSMNYVEELNALNHKGVFDKMHQSNGEKRESRR
jgi:hypothetical protein